MEENLKHVINTKKHAYFMPVIYYLPTYSL